SLARWLAHDRQAKRRTLIGRLAYWRPLSHPFESGSMVHRRLVAQLVEASRVKLNLMAIDRADRYRRTDWLGVGKCTAAAVYSAKQQGENGNLPGSALARRRQMQMTLNGADCDTVPPK